jgi:hypothetical protein
LISKPNQPRLSFNYIWQLACPFLLTAQTYERSDWAINYLFLGLDIPILSLPPRQQIIASTILNGRTIPVPGSSGIPRTRDFDGDIEQACLTAGQSAAASTRFCAQNLAWRVTALGIGAANHAVFGYLDLAVHRYGLLVEPLERMEMGGAERAHY